MFVCVCVYLYVCASAPYVPIFTSDSHHTHSCHFAEETNFSFTFTSIMLYYHLK